MCDSPKVSIIVPVYKVEKYLARCMDSLLNQSLKAIEIIMVDDGSPDNCPALCDEYAAKDDRVKVIHKRNEGLGLARNSGLDIASGEFVAFVDSDDYVKTSMFEELYAKGEEIDADVVFCNYSKVDRNGKVTDIIEETQEAVYDTKGSIVQLIFDMVSAIPTADKERKFTMSVWHGIYRLSRIKENNIKFLSEREMISEDIIFHINYLDVVEKIKYINTCNYYYCKNEESLSRILRIDRFDKNKVLHQYIIQLLSQKYPEKKNDILLYSDRLLIGYVRYLCLRYKITFRSVRSVYNDPYLREVLSRYPYSDLPFKYALFVRLLIKKRAFIILLISVISKK